MTIEDAASVLQATLMPELTRYCRAQIDAKTTAFSHQHAEELYACGISSGVDGTTSGSGKVVLRVTLSSMLKEIVRGEVVCFGSPAAFGTLDYSIEQKGFSKASIEAVVADLPRLLSAFELALSRGMARKKGKKDSRTRRYSQPR